MRKYNSASLGLHASSWPWSCIDGRRVDAVCSEGHDGGDVVVNDADVVDVKVGVECHEDGGVHDDDVVYVDGYVDARGENDGEPEHICEDIEDERDGGGDAGHEVFGILYVYGVVVVL
jgi:hypothetical protein